MTYSEIKEKARSLRKNQTKEENLLWQELRNRKLNGFKFLRQYPIIHEIKNKNLFFFVADFYCHEAKLSIELDGKIHDFQKEKDNRRDSIIKEFGINVLRIKNEELNNLEEVKKKILNHLPKK